MIRKVFALIFTLICLGSIYAQEIKGTSESPKSTKFSLQSGIGYYTNLYGYFRSDLGALPGSEPGQPGSILWNELLVSLNEKNAIGFLVGYGRVKFTAYNRFDDLIAPSRIDNNYTVFGLHFYRNVQVNRSSFLFGIGPHFQVDRSPRVEYDRILIEENGERYIVPYNFRVEYYDDGALGVGLDLNYSYKLNKNLYLGARVNTSFLMYYGIEGFMVSPFIRIGY